jgi:predicted metal-dependent phosphoesterase TrpH
MRYDFHVHTSNYSPCSRSTASSICQRAIELGLAGIALTEHDLWWPRPELVALRNEFTDLTILEGIEYACPEGHFLVFLPHPEAIRDLKARRILNLIKEVHHQDGIVIWAHPFRFDYSLYLDWLDAAELDGIEVASHNMDDPLKILAQSVAVQNGFMQFENSDAHHVDNLGKYFNEIPIVFKNNREFIDYVSTWVLHENR